MSEVCEEPFIHEIKIDSIVEEKIIQKELKKLGKKTESKKNKRKKEH